MQKKIPLPISNPPGAKFPGFQIFFIWYGRSLYKSAKLQLSTPYETGLAFLYKDTTVDSMPNFGPLSQYFPGFGFVPLVWVIPL